MILIRQIVLLSTFFYIGQVSAGIFTNKCIGKDLTIAPNPKTYTDSDGKTQDTDEWKAWKNSRSDWESAQNYSCCEKLVLNGRTCKDPSLQDADLKSCTSDGGCPAGLGCYKLREDDLFSADPDDPQSEQAAAEKQKKFDEQQNSLGEDDPKPDGSTCYRDMECESYKCDNFQCKENKICRQADQGEVANGNVTCEKPFTRDSATGVCGDASVKLFVLGLSKINIQQEPGLQCQFKLEGIGTENQIVSRDELHAIIHTAIKTLRGMEWLFASASPDNHHECQFALKYLRDKMQGLLEKRKSILKDFNINMKKVESNNVKVNQAKKDDMAQIETLCSNNGGKNFELTTAHDVALRKASGKDFICYMQRRNELFQVYELAMKAWLGEVSQFLDAYNKTVFTWEEDKKDWTVADKSYSYKDRACRDWADWHKKVKRRWGKRYKVAGAHRVNTDIVERQGVVPAYLNILGAREKLNGGRYYLLDPLMPGGWNQGVSFGNFGRNRNWNGDDDRYLEDDSGYRNIFQNTTSKIHSFYRNLKVGNDVSAEEYIYEPELVGAYENKGCIDKLSDEKCSKFSKLIDQIHEVAFAQMLAYSYHNQKKYKSYYRSEGTLRRVLFGRYSTDYNNLGLYYTALSGPGGLRDKQNVCLQRVLDDLNGKDFNGDGQGITEGGNNYYNPTNTDYMGGNSGPKNYIKPQVKSNLGSPIKFNLNSLSMSMKSSGLKDDASSSSSAGSGSMGDASSNALAARVKEMQDANAKAAAKGVNLSAKENDLKKELIASGLGSSMSGTSARSGGAGSLNSSGASKTNSSSDQSSAQGTSEDDQSKDKNGAIGASTQGAGGGSGVFGIASGSGSGSDNSQYGSSQNSGGANPSGLSDEEKEMMAANYDRNKGNYKPNEDDTLFKVLSKTYMRSLDKILQRKKKGEAEPVEKKPSQQ
jgi:hypothetical protein